MLVLVSLAVAILYFIELNRINRGEIENFTNLKGFIGDGRTCFMS